MGERTPLALLDARRVRRAWRSARRSPTSPPRDDRRARRRQAVGQLDGRLPAHPGEDAALYDDGARRRRWSCARRSASRSRSARTRCRCSTVLDATAASAKTVVAPVSLIVSAFAPVARRAPHADAAAAHRRGDTALLLDRPRRAARNRLGGSCLAQVYGAARRRRRPTSTIRALLAASSPRSRSCARAGSLLAYHDRSDGGLFATLFEMAFAGRCGARRRSGRAGGDAARGAVQRGARRGAAGARARRRSACASVLARHGLARFAHAHRHAPTSADRVRIRARRRRRCSTKPRTTLRARVVRDDASRMQRAARRPGLRRRGVRRARSTPTTRACSAALDLRSARGRRRAVHRAGRAAAGRDPARAGRQRPGRDGRGVRPRRLRGRRRAHERPDRRARDARRLPAASSPAAASPTATCWAPARAGRSRSCSTRARATQFAALLRARRHLRARRLQRLPDDGGAAGAHPRRASTGRASCATAREQFEARLSLVEVAASRRRCFFAGMAGSRLPIAVAHGEGRAEFAIADAARGAATRRSSALRFVDNHGARRRALSRQPERLAATASPASRRPTAASRS